MRLKPELNERTNEGKYEVGKLSICIRRASFLVKPYLINTKKKMEAQELVFIETPNAHINVGIGSGRANATTSEPHDMQ